MFSLETFLKEYETDTSNLTIRGRNFSFFVPKNLDRFLDPDDMLNDFPIMVFRSSKIALIENVFFKSEVIEQACRNSCLAFSGLICGLFITPVHLCVSLSATYFDAPLHKILLHLLGPVIFIAIGGIMMAFLS